MREAAKTLRLIRNKGWYGRFRALTLKVDGNEVGTIQPGQTLDIEVAHDARQLVGHMDWGTNDPLMLADIPDGATIEVNARFSLNTLRQLGVIGIPIRFEPRET